MKKLAAVAIAILLIIPIIPTQYNILVEKSIVEEYTTTEPYTAYDTVQVPYRASSTIVYWQETEGYRRWRTEVKTSIENSLPSYYGLGESWSGRWVIEDVGVSGYRTVQEPVTRYRAVTKTRTVYSPAVEIRTRRVSILYYIIGG
ncbi:hypothetical protein LCGC14_0591340 [marine sediment metagenome]|uniref:Uncharacterized protein n=1 Tax=marine sediment metagenome TaxID=412755 RepID=A0A0F9RX75_9ZZZZ